MTATRPSTRAAQLHSGHSPSLTDTYTGIHFQGITLRLNVMRNLSDKGLYNGKGNKVIGVVVEAKGNISSSIPFMVSVHAYLSVYPTIHHRGRHSTTSAPSTGQGSSQSVCWCVCTLQECVGVLTLHVLHFTSCVSSCYEDL